MRGIFAIGLLAAFTLNAEDFQSELKVDKKNLGTKGANPYFPLTPGYKLEFAHGKDTRVWTITSDTKKIDGVETVVVEDREMKDGQLAELTKDYFAIDVTTNDVYYFGEDVEVYKKGKVVSRKGSWLSGVNGAKFGLYAPGKPSVGKKYYQEIAPGVGKDRAEVLSVTETVVTPAGKFENCVHTLETSPIEKSLKDHKWYAPGVGEVKDDQMQLVKYSTK